MGFNPQQISQMRERAEQQKAKELAAIAAGTMQDPRLAIQYAGPLSASARKYQQEQLKKVIGPLSPSAEASITQSAIAYDQKIRAADKAQAEQRARAGAVGARSEAIKQQEQRATTPVQSIQQPSNESYLYKVKLSDSVGASSNISATKKTPNPLVTKLKGGSSSTKTKSSFVLLGSPPEVFESKSESTIIKQTGVKDLIGPIKPTNNDPLESAADFIEGISKQTRKNPSTILLGPPIGAAREGLASFGSLVNLERLGGEHFVKFFTGKYPSSSQSEIPKTIGGELTGGLFKSGSSLVQGSPEKASLDLDEAGKNIKGLVKERGGFETTGELTAFIAPFGKDVLRISPLKVTSLPIETEKGISNIGKQISLGYGSKTKPLLTTIGKKLNVGGKTSGLEKSSLSEISPTSRGFEFGTETPQAQKILLSEPATSTLEKAGKLTSKDVEQLSDLRKASKIIGFSEKTVKQRAKVEAFPETPSTAVLPGKESEVLVEQVIPKLKPIKGTIVEKVQIEALPRGPEITTSDIDVDYAKIILGTRRAERRARISAEQLQAVADPGRQFSRSGSKVFVQSTKGKEKVLELLTSKDVDPTASSLNKNLGQVFGSKLGSKVVKIKTKGGKTVKLITLESQTLRRIASASALQGPRTEKFAGTGAIDYLRSGKTLAETPLGFRVGPPEARLKDLARLPRNFVQIARNLEDIGQTEKATKLKDIAERIVKRYPEIDFEKYPSDIDIEVINLPSRIGSLTSSGRSLTPAGILIPIRSSKEKQRQLKIDVSTIGRQTRSQLGSVISRQSNYISNSINSLGPISKSPIGNTSRLNQSLSNLSRGNYGGFSKSGFPKGSRATPQSRGTSPVFPPSKGPSPGTSPGPTGYPTFGKPPRSPPSRGPSRGPSGSIRLTSFRTPEIRIPLFLKLSKTKRRKTPLILSKRLFIADPVDPKRAGVIAPRGVSQLVSRKSTIFKTIDVNLGKARKYKYAIRPFGI